MTRITVSTTGPTGVTALVARRWASASAPAHRVATAAATRSGRRRIRSSRAGPAQRRHGCLVGLPHRRHRRRRDPFGLAKSYGSLRSAPERTDPRDGADARPQGLLAGRQRRRRLLLRRRRVLRLHRRHPPQQDDHRHRVDADRPRLLARRRRRRHLRLRRRQVLRLHRRHPPQQAHRRHRDHADRARATGSSRATAASSPSATPSSTAPPAR